jgi:low temperature requirement protein LtrA
MKPDAPKSGFSYELLLFVTIAEPFELLAVHFLISRSNGTIAWAVTISSILMVASLWWVWLRQKRREASLKLEVEESREAL